MLSQFTCATVRMLDWLAAYMPRPDSVPAHQRIGRRARRNAYFYLRKKGYLMVARNFHSPLRRGEIDLIGWEKDVLGFIEVKTRTTHDVKPAEAAVDWESGCGPGLSAAPSVGSAVAFRRGQRVL
jgi:putative endonuclease